MLRKLSILKSVLKFKTTIFKNIIELTQKLFQNQNNRKRSPDFENLQNDEKGEPIILGIFSPRGPEETLRMFSLFSSNQRVTLQGYLRNKSQNLNLSFQQSWGSKASGSPKASKNFVVIFPKFCGQFHINANLLS